MKLENYSKVVHEAWSTHQVLRRLGFSTDDIYFAVNSSVELGGADGFYVLLRCQDKIMTIFCGGARSYTLDEFTEFCELFNGETGSLLESEFNIILDNSFIMKEKVSFVTALLSKGFTLPYQGNPITGSEVVSPEGSAVRAIRYDVTPEVRQGLNAGVSSLPIPKKLLN